LCRRKTFSPPSTRCECACECDEISRHLRAYTQVIKEGSKFSATPKYLVCVITALVARLCALTPTCLCVQIHN
jgi:hypothetical protein